MSRKIFTFDDLTNHIGEDYTWRRKELKLIKDQISAAPLDSPKQHAALRFSVPILYAHWEGFTKKCCEAYLEFVANKYLNHNELQPQFIALSLTKKTNKLEIKNIEEKTDIVKFLLVEFAKRSNIPTKNIIQTRSNLKFYVLEEILFIIGIDLEKFNRFKSLIDDLVDARNNIAHGQYLRIGLSTYESMHDEIQIVMELLKTEIENSAIRELYKVTA